MVKLDEGNRLVDAGKFAEARNLFLELIQDIHVAPPVRGRARVGEIRSLIGMGDLQEASEIVERILSGKERKVHHNLRPSILHQRARLAALGGDVQLAIRYYREELLYLSSSMSHYFPRLAENYIQQGTLFLELGDRHECEIYLRLARDYADTGTSDKASAGMLILKGRCHAEDGEFQQALDTFCEARDLYIQHGMYHESHAVEKRMADLRQKMEEQQHGG